MKAPCPRHVGCARMVVAKAWHSPQINSANLPDTLTLPPPTCSAVLSGRVTPSGNAAPPGRLARGGDRAAPTGICDCSRRGAAEDHNPAGTAPWGHQRGGCESTQEDGERCRRFESSSQGIEGAAQGPTASVRPARRAQALGARISRALTLQCPERGPRPGTNRGPAAPGNKCGKPAAAGCRGGFGQQLRVAAAAAETERARPQERAGRRVRIGRVSAGASCRQSAEVRDGRGGRSGDCGAVRSHWLDKWEPRRGKQPGPWAPLGRTQSWRQDPGPFTGDPSPEVHLPQDEGNGCSPRARHFPREGRVFRAGCVGTALQRLWAKPLLLDVDLLSSSAACLGSETRRRNAHPTPHSAPALSPQSPSFALLRQHLGLTPSSSQFRQHLGLTPSSSQEKLKKRARFLEPAGDSGGAARILYSLEIPSPWF
ncbi:putative Allantoicase [Manis pentadactyla]|nr:putative Allantoicase [Manis pentadactyla]